MEIRLLKSFNTVAALNSFTAASEELNYSQSSISDQIRKLEADLDTVLFERIGNRIELTHDGRKLLEYSSRILNLCSEAETAMSSSDKDTVKGVLKVGMTESQCFYKLPDLLMQYNNLYPDVELNLKMGSCYDFPDWLNSSVIDIAFVLDDETDYPNLVTHILSEEKLVIVAGGGSRIADKHELSPEDFKDQTLILTPQRSKYRELFDRYLDEKKIKYKSHLDFESIEAIKHFVKSGHGISFLPETTVRKEIESKVLVSFDTPDAELSIYSQVLYHKDKWISPALKALLTLSDNFAN